MAWYWFLALALIVVGVIGFALHRLIRRLGEAGLVDYLPVAPSKRAAGTALLTYQALFEPAVEHVIEYQRSGGLTAQTSGEPGPQPPDSAPAPGA